MEALRAEVASLNIVIAKQREEQEQSEDKSIPGWVSPSAPDSAPRSDPVPRSECM